MEISSYLRQLCEDLSSASPQSAEDVELLTEPMELPADTVVPLALIVSELFTNAAEARLCRRPARQDHRYSSGVCRRGCRIEVADDGPGKPADVMPDFGTNLVQALARQINAELRECSDASGTRVTIEVPAPARGEGPEAAAS